jgi:hypothetical protein
MSKCSSDVSRDDGCGRMTPGGEVPREQRSENRSQRTEDRDQGSEIRRQTSSERLRGGDESRAARAH